MTDTMNGTKAATEQIIKDLMAEGYTREEAEVRVREAKAIAAPGTPVHVEVELQSYGTGAQYDNIVDSESIIIDARAVLDTHGTDELPEVDEWHDHNGDADFIYEEAAMAGLAPEWDDAFDVTVSTYNYDTYLLARRSGLLVPDADKAKADIDDLTAKAALHRAFNGIESLVGKTARRTGMTEHEVRNRFAANILGILPTDVTLESGKPLGYGTELDPRQKWSDK